MTEEERKAYLAEKALKEAVEQAVNDLTRAVEDKATIKEKPVESPEEVRHCDGREYLFKAAAR